MGWGERIVSAIEARRDRKRKHLPGAHGEFFRAGGNDLLYDVPVGTGDVVIDAGGYRGEWTSRMISRYGCRCEIYEPFPLYAESLTQVFARNALVHVHAAALGGSARITKFTFLEDGTSEHGQVSGEQSVESLVEDVSSAIDSLGVESIACLKLNIEGGEYEVLERLVATGHINKVVSLLIQFHSQPVGWEIRLNEITTQLEITHRREWGYAMVWEKWVKHSDVQMRVL